LESVGAGVCLLLSIAGLLVQDNGRPSLFGFGVWVVLVATGVLLGFLGTARGGAPSRVLAGLCLVIGLPLLACGSLLRMPVPVL
jgi:hypothetical protein